MTEVIPRFTAPSIPQPTLSLGRTERQIRFVDLCAGLGGFHYALHQLQDRVRDAGWRFTCVAAAELNPDLRRLYVENFDDVAAHYIVTFPSDRILMPDTFGSGDGEAETFGPAWLEAALPEYDAGQQLMTIHGDLGVFLSKDKTDLRRWSNGEALLPEHDLLCAGFPCQPFSKSGAQRGFEDTRGTVFHQIATILDKIRPSFVLLENVANFARHNGGHTWLRVKEILESMNYMVRATEHKGSGAGAPGMLSPHLLGYPHHRERFFIIAQLRCANSESPLDLIELLGVVNSHDAPFPHTNHVDWARMRSFGAGARTSAEQLAEILDSHKNKPFSDGKSSLSISEERSDCAVHWETLLVELNRRGVDRAGVAWKDTIPSFPIWGFELDPWNWYPYDINPGPLLTRPHELASARSSQLSLADRQARLANPQVDILDFPPAGAREWLADVANDGVLDEWVATLPGYARLRAHWPTWKVRFISQNREWAIKLWTELDPAWLRRWLDDLYTAIPAASHQKLEWNCKGDPLTLSRKILQFRPSGLRVKRASCVPALVAMTTTQVPVVSDEDWTLANGQRPPLRHLHHKEGLRLQGFPSTWHTPDSREAAFKALGNAVHAGLVADLVGTWLFQLPPTNLDSPAKTPRNRPQTINSAGRT